MSLNDGLYDLFSQGLRAVDSGFSTETLWFASPNTYRVDNEAVRYLLKVSPKSKPYLNGVLRKVKSSVGYVVTKECVTLSAYGKRALENLSNLSIWLYDEGAHTFSRQRGLRVLSVSGVSDESFVTGEGQYRERIDLVVTLAHYGYVKYDSFGDPMESVGAYRV